MRGGFPVRPCRHDGVGGMEQAASKRDVVHVAGMDLGFTLEGEGAPLLVVGSSVYYPRTFSRALRKSFTLICADLPHFTVPAARSGPGTVSFDFYAECIESVRAASGFDTVIVAGHSHHGNVALEYAKRYPERASHVVMIGSPPVDTARTQAGARQYWETRASERRRLLLRERRAELTEDHLATLSPEEAFVARYVADAPIYWHDPDYDASWLWRDMRFRLEAVQAFRNLYTDYTLDWDTDALRAPVLIVMGRSDFAVPYTLWEPVLPHLRNMSFQLLHQCGHTPQLERRRTFDRLLLDWLGRER